MHAACVGPVRHNGESLLHRTNQIHANGLGIRRNGLQSRAHRFTQQGTTQNHTRSAQVVAATPFIYSTDAIKFTLHVFTPRHSFFGVTAPSYLRSMGATTLDPNKHAII